jgi:hypothetical protein
MNQYPSRMKCYSKTQQAEQAREMSMSTIAFCLQELCSFLVRNVYTKVGH